MSDVSSQGVLKCQICQAQVSACQIKPYLVRFGRPYLFISLLGSVGAAYNQRWLICFYENHLPWLIIKGDFKFNKYGISINNQMIKINHVLVNSND